MSSEIIELAEDSMKHRLDILESDFNSMRTGRASAAILDKITVDYYGVATPITQIAGIKVPEANLLVVEPWDKSILNAVEKAIQASDIGITPNSDGTCVRLPFPAPTEERRKEMVKQCRKYAEEARVTIRNARRDANSEIEKMKKDGEISEDEMRREQDEVQKLTDRYVKLIDDLVAEKEKEIMEI